MTRLQDGKVIVVLLVALALLVALLLPSCSEEPEPDYAQKAIEVHERVEKLQAQAAQARKESLVQGHQLQRAQESLAAAETRAQNARRHLDLERFERQGAESAVEAAEQDFTVAWVSAFSVALLALLLLSLLSRE